LSRSKFIFLFTKLIPTTLADEIPWDTDISIETRIYNAVLLKMLAISNLLSRYRNYISDSGHKYDTWVGILVIWVGFSGRNYIPAGTPQGIHSRKAAG